MDVTMSVVKADAGSIGGHTMPSKGMLDKVNGMVDDAIRNDLPVDAMVTYTDDDIAIRMSHTNGEGAAPVPRWLRSNSNCFPNTGRLRRSWCSLRTSARPGRTTSRST